MKKIYLSALAVIMFALSVQLSAQNCTRALQPVITTLAESTPGAGDGLVDIIWDINCADRDPFVDGLSTCPDGDANSLIWYVGFYGQNAPAPNGLNGECDTGLATSQCAGFPGLPLSNGGDYGAQCLEPKGSTCESFEFSQNIGGTIHTWSAPGACAGFGGIGGIQLCPGQCYNVMVWEVVIDRPGDFGTTTGMPFPGFDANAACGNVNIIDESPASPIAAICLSGTNALVNIPSLTVSSSTATCGAATTTYVGTYQGQPEDIGDGGADNTTIYDGVPCTVQDIDAQIVIDQGTGAVDQTIGATGNGGDAGDISVTSTPGAGNSANGDLTLGAHVVEVNCREDVTMVFNTPVTCEGVNDITDFGIRVCDDSDGTLYSNSKVYISNNGTPVETNAGGFYYPTCDFTADDDPIYTEPIGQGTDECASNMGVGYPSNWTAQFGPFLSSDATGDCIRNLIGNPFAGAGVSPFSLAGTTQMDFGDGILRDVATVCVSFEDPCDGSKSATCVKFISDMSPMAASLRACPITCATGTGTTDDGLIIIEDLIGGSSDQDGNADTDGSYTGGYTFLIDGAAATFTNVAGTGDWVSDPLAPGTYFVEIMDPNAPACGSACDIAGTITIVAAPPVIVTGTDATSCAGVGGDEFTINMNTQVVVPIADEIVTAGPMNAPANGACNDGGIGAPNDGSGQTLTYTIAGVIDGAGNAAPTADTAPVIICFDNMEYTASTSACGVLNTSGIAIQAPSGTLVSWFFLGDAFGGTFTGGVVDGCFDFSAAFPGEAVNGDWNIFFADLACGAGCDPVTAGGWTADDVSFEFADHELNDVADINACAGASPGTAPADAPVGGYVATQTSGPTAVSITVTGSTITGVIPDDTVNPGGYAGGTMCFDLEIYVPGQNFADDGEDPTCTNMECCAVTVNVCADITGCTPAELVLFDGVAKGDVNELVWETASELNTAWYIVERSIDNKDAWQELGRVKAAGNSLTALNYNFTDAKPLTLGYYRLKMVDVDGTFEYSNSIVLDRKEGGKGIVEIFPIPTDNEVTVQYEVGRNTDVSFTVTDVLGRIISQQTVEASTGLNYYTADMTNQATGLYFVTFSDGTTEQTRRVIKN